MWSGGAVERRVHLVLLALLCAGAVLHPASAHAHELVGPGFGISAHAAPAAPVVGERRIAVVRTAFTGYEELPADRELLDAAIFGAPDSVAAFFGRSSYEQLRMVGDVTPLLWTSSDPQVCDVRRWQRDSEQAAATAGIDLDSYDHVAFVYPSSRDCRSSAYAELGGRITWFMGYLSDPARVRHVFAHELGHNFGFNHANSLRCVHADGAAEPLADACTSTEYGDPFDVMGTSSHVGPINSLYRLRAGWFAPDEVVDVDADRVLTLTAVDAPATSDGVRVARIARQRSAEGSPPELLHAELRSADDPAGASAAGVHLRLAPAADTSSDRSQLIDARPGTATRADAPLQAGDLIYDGSAGLTLRVHAVDGDGGGDHLQLAVQYGFDTTPPRAASHVTAEQHLPEATSQTTPPVRVCWQPASDERRLLRYELERDGERIARLESDATCHEDPAAEAGAVHSYRVIALDLARNESASETASVAVLPGSPPLPPGPPLPSTEPAQDAADETTALVDEADEVIVGGFVEASGEVVDGFNDWIGDQLP